MSKHGLTKNKLDGITLHDIPIEDIIKYEKDQDSLNAFKSEVILKKNLIPPIHCKNKYKTEKEKNSVVKTLSQKQINKEYFTTNLKMAKSARELVICILLKGYNQPYTNKQLLEDLKQMKNTTFISPKKPYTNKQLLEDLKQMKNTTFISPKIKIPSSITVVASIMARLMKSELSQYIVKKTIKDNTGAKIVNINTFEMIDVGLHLKPQEAFELGKGIKKSKGERTVTDKPIDDSSTDDHVTTSKDTCEPTTLAHNTEGASKIKATDINIQIDNSVKSVVVKINKKTLSNMTDITVSFD